jgi:hypothetical protein
MQEARQRDQRVRNCWMWSWPAGARPVWPWPGTSPGGACVFVVLEAGARLGHVWRSRWDSLQLFTPAQYNALPGLPFPGPADNDPTKDPVADYLEAYANAFHLPVRFRADYSWITSRAWWRTAAWSTGAASPTCPPVLPRPDLAAHPRVGAARLRQGRRRVPRRPHHGIPAAGGARRHRRGAAAMTGTRASTPMQLPAAATRRGGR